MSAQKSPPLELPKELSAALRGNSAAKKLFSALSYSCRREYVQWIGQAKQPESRTRRATQAVERILQK